MKAFSLFWFGSLVALSSLRADQIEMQNGDRYHGKVLAMTNSNLILQSEILGSLTLPREKVSQILLGNVAVTRGSNAAPVKSDVKALNRPATTNLLASTNSAATAEAAEQKKLTQQIQDEFLAGADPEAKNKYNEMVNAFLSGKLSLGDIRAQAKSAADQLRSARKDLGEDAG